MKKYIILISIVVVAISIVVYAYYQNIITNNAILQNNKDYESLYEKELTGTELATLINKAINKNNENNIAKDSDGIYINNDTNSINVEVKFKQSNEFYAAEKIEKNDISKFIELYSIVNFKCTKIEYHSKTKYVKYMLFEEI